MKNRWLAAVLTLCLLTAAGLMAILGDGTAGAAVPTTPANTVVAVKGTDGALWYEANGSGWASLGGGLLDTPAVASVNGTPVFAAIGTDHELYVADVANPRWLGMGGYCIDTPAAGVVGNDLVLSCVGGDSAVWWESVPTSALTAWNASVIQANANTWTSVGGVLGAGPAILATPGGPVFLAAAPNHQVWYNQGGSWAPTTLYCNGHVAADAYDLTFQAGCQGLDDHMYEGSSNDGTVPLAWASQGGALIGGPGIATFTDPTTSVLFAEGTGHAVYYANPGGTWIGLGGVVSGDGVSATSLGPTVNYEVDDGTNYWLGTSPLSEPNTNTGYEDGGVTTNLGAASSFAGINATGSSNLAANVWLSNGNDDATTPGKYPLSAGVNFCYGLGSGNPTTGMVTSFYMTGSQTACGADYGQTISAAKIASDFAADQAIVWVGTTSNGTATVSASITSINEMPVSATVTLDSTSASAS